MQNLKISLVQTPLEWENPAKNKELFKKTLSDDAGGTDLIILPEMFTTGFSMNPKNIAEDNRIYDYLSQLSSRHQCAIYGSVMFNTGSGYVNRGIFMTPAGDYHLYDKRHTFTLAGEEKVYDHGDKLKVIEYKGWKINLQICYDLRFPVWSRNTQNYDLLIYVANWPAPRTTAWDALLKARAIENMAYCAGVNRIGKDGNDMPYDGHSQVYDVLGSPMLENPWESAGVRHIILERSHITDNRERFKFLQDADRFSLG